MLQRQLGDDFEIDIRLIKDMIRDQRNVALSRLLNKKSPYVNSSLNAYAQTFVSRLVAVPNYGATVDDCENDYTVWRSDSNINGLLNINGFNGIYSVYIEKPTGVRKKAIGSSQDRLTFIGSGRFNQKEYIWFLDDVPKQYTVYIATKGHDNLELNNGMMTVKAIFSDPEEANPNVDNGDDYPLPAESWAYMQDYIVNKLLQKLQMPEDRINDSTDEIR